MVDPTQIPDTVRDLYPFQSHFLDVDGGRMHYIDEGPRDGPVIVAVHGNPTWSFYYRNVVLALRDDHRCIAPDHIGCGLSDKPPLTDYPTPWSVASTISRPSSRHWRSPAGSRSCSTTGAG